MNNSQNCRTSKPRSTYAKPCKHKWRCVKWEEEPTSQRCDCPRPFGRVTTTTTQYSLRAALLPFLPLRRLHLLSHPRTLWMEWSSAAVAFKVLTSSLPLGPSGSWAMSSLGGSTQCLIVGITVLGWPRQSRKSRPCACAGLPACCPMERQPCLLDWGILHSGQKVILGSIQLF